MYYVKCKVDFSLVCYETQTSYVAILSHYMF